MHVDIVCPPDTEYMECGPSCDTTCAAIAADEDCRDVCIPGCFCPDGKVKDYQGACVESKECMCELHGQFYDSGDIVPVECGQW